MSGVSALVQEAPENSLGLLPCEHPGEDDRQQTLNLLAP